jgi:hypothetical protein
MGILSSKSTPHRPETMVVHNQPRLRNGSASTPAREPTREPHHPQSDRESLTQFAIRFMEMQEKKQLQDDPYRCTDMVLNSNPHYMHIPPAHSSHGQCHGNHTTTSTSVAVAVAVDQSSSPYVTAIAILDPTVDNTLPSAPPLSLAIDPHSTSSLSKT